jgi:FkbM family methyltransferase
MCAAIRLCQGKTLEANDNLKEGLSRFLAEPRLTNVTDAAGRRWLSIPGHEADVIRAYENTSRRWRFSRHGNAEFYEETATLVFSYLLDQLRPATVFDIGAWQGYFSFLAASHTAARPTVFGFDMRPPGIEAIRDRVRELGWTDRVHPHLCGLSDTHIGATRVWAARMKMFESKPREEEYREAVWRRLKFFLKGDTRRGLREVDLTVTTLDRFCADHGVAPQLMKIDVDGYEGKILRGAENLLRTAKPTILLELHRDEAQRDGITRTKVADILFEAGYDALFLTDHHTRTRCQLVPVRPGHPLLGRQETDMLVFYPADAAG